MDDFTILQSSGSGSSSTPWIVIGIIFLIALAGAYFGLQYYKKYQKRPPGRSCSGGWKCLPGNIGFQEITSDPSLSTPDEELYLAEFSQSSSLGPPVCIPMWYCLRYVNVNTGGYSKYGPWIKLPVNAGAATLPYPSSNQGPLGKNTCQFNRPTIGVKTLKYPFLPDKDGKMIAANLHRYTPSSESDINPPPDPNTTSVKTDIVGYLLPFTDRAGGITYAWADIMKNPCKNKCSRCKGC